MSALFKGLPALIVLHRAIPAGNLLFRQLLGGLAVVLALLMSAVICSIALVMLGFYWFYSYLLAQGVEPQAAMASLGGLMLLLIVGFSAAAFYWSIRLREIPKKVMLMEFPLTRRASNAINAFLDGLLKPSGKA